MEFTKDQLILIHNTFNQIGFKIGQSKDLLTAEQIIKKCQEELTPPQKEEKES